ncbi:MAG: hypothetical protein QG586_1302, partial [Pseudomonadota bacterium]|nr:hypothetical protein [Pseudomonadota bacterium]
MQVSIETTSALE